MSLTLNFLISTINNRILGLKKIIKNYPLDINVIYTVSHQVTNELNSETKKYIETLKNSNDVIYSRIFSRGVATNRNNALKHRVKNSICLLCDDDVIYSEKGLYELYNSFIRYPDIDILTFKIKTFKGYDYKFYKNHVYKHSLKSLTNIGIVDVAFREEIIDKYDLKFDERFGPGAIYPIGEDFIFMTDAFKKNINIYFHPIDVVMHDEIGTGSILRDDVIWGRGAMFARVFKHNAFFINLYFSLKHYSSYKSKYSLKKYLKLINSGSKDFCKRYNCE